MIYDCPFCSTQNEYESKGSKTKRKRKDCVSCGKRFEIKATQLVKPMVIPKVDQSQSMTNPMTNPTTKPNDQVDLEYGELELDDRDQDILMLIKDGWGQIEIAKSLKISPTAVGKRIKPLVKCGLLIEFNSRPRTYKIDPNFKKPSKKTAAFKPMKILTMNHLYPIRLDIIGDEPGYEKFRNDKETFAKLEGWARKHFNENNLNIILNTKSITYNVSGIGYSIPEMFSNAKDKAVLVYQNLKTKYNLKLGFPEFVVERGKVRPHIIPFKPVSEEQVNQLYTDISDKGHVETDDPYLAGSIQHAINGNLENEKKITDMEVAMKALAESQANLNQVLPQMIQAQAQLTQAMAQMMQGQAQIMQMLQKLTGAMPGDNINAGSGKDPKDSLYG